MKVSNEWSKIKNDESDTDIIDNHVIIVLAGAFAFLLCLGIIWQYLYLKNTVKGSYGLVISYNNNAKSLLRTTGKYRIKLYQIPYACVIDTEVIELEVKKADSNSTYVNRIKEEGFIKCLSCRQCKNCNDQIE